MTKITSCKDCQDREIGCHDKCEKYLAERAARDRENEAKRKRVKDYEYFFDHGKQRQTRNLKYKQRKRG